MKNRMGYKTLTFLVLTMVLTMALGTMSAFATQQQQQVTKYKVIWPDGTKSEEVYDTEEAAKAVADKEKLLYKGKTDAKGKITLEKWFTVGEIRIVEKEVPAGYTTETMETKADLSDGEVTIVNKKESTTTAVAPTTEDNDVNDENEEPVESKSTKGAKTGDENNMTVWLLLMIGSATGLVATLRKYYR